MKNSEGRLGGEEEEGGAHILEWVVGGCSLGQLLSVRETYNGRLSLCVLGRCEAPLLGPAHAPLHRRFVPTIIVAKSTPAPQPPLEKLEHSSRRAKLRVAAISWQTILDFFFLFSQTERTFLLTHLLEVSLFPYSLKYKLIVYVN